MDIDNDIDTSNNNRNQFENVNQKENEKYKDKMKKIYDSIIKDPIFKNHINLNRDNRIKFIQNFPYDNLPHNETFVFNNLCVFNDLSCVNGYFNINDNLKIIDFNSNFKLNEKINLSQRCLLPENLFHSKYDYKNIIPPLDKKSIKDLLI